MEQAKNLSLTKSNQSNEVEVLCIGTELLLGNILNSNAKWLAEQLALIGISHFRQTVIGDNIERVKKEIIAASNRSRGLITTGGLGPTNDDITNQAIAIAFNVELIESKKILKDIKDKLEYSDQSFPEINNKQALYPKGAQITQNKLGTAPGIIWNPKTNFTIITFPGVPSEMKHMWRESVKDWLQSNLKYEGVITSKTLKFTGITESALAEKVDKIFDNKNPTVAPYASLGEVKIRITAKGKDQHETYKLIEPIQNKLIEIGGENFFGSDNDSIFSVIVDLLKARRQTLSIAESCTGGSLGGALTSIPEASKVFKGGLIAYSNSAKMNLLDIPKSTLEKHGAVSSETVKLMAQAIRKKFGTDWGVAISGIAGPSGGTSDKPIGLIHFGIAGRGFVKSSQKVFNKNRSRVEIQQLSVIRSLDLLRSFLLKDS